MATVPVAVHDRRPHRQTRRPDRVGESPVAPLASTRDFKMPLPAPDTNGVVTLYLATSDAGDGSANDFAVWENPRLVAPGRADLPLRHLRAGYAAFNTKREKIFSSAAHPRRSRGHNEALDEAPLNKLAKQHHVEPYALAAWLSTLASARAA